MPHILRRPVGLDVVRVQRSIPKQSVGAVRPTGVGGVGWRPGVPHIVIMAGDTTPCCPFPVGHVMTEYISPISPRGVGEVPVAFMRGGARDYDGIDPGIWYYTPPDPEFPSPTEPYGTWAIRYGTPYPVNTDRYERSGTVGDYLVSPSNAATLPATLQALADLDIAVVTLSNRSVANNYITVRPPIRDVAPNEMSLETLNTLYSDGVSHVPGPSYPNVPDPYGGGPYGELHTTGACLAALTGAVIEDPDTTDPAGGPVLMSYRWGSGVYSPIGGGDQRWTTPTNLDASSFTAFLAPRIVQLAENLGNGDDFDVAILVDNSGSFGASDGVAAQVFRDLITTFRAENRNIHVAVSRFSDYNEWSYYNASGYYEDRPFYLMYPVSSIDSAEDYATMLAALNDAPIGNGGDSPESNYEGLYQIATGVGFDGSADQTGADGAGDPTDLVLPDGNTTMSGEPLVRGAPLSVVDVDGGYVSGTLFNALIDLGYSGAEAIAFIDQYEQFHTSQGLGYMLPGISGDVPSFTGSPVIRRGAAAIQHRQNQIWTYPKS